MFEQIKHSMETIAGVAVYPVVSLSIFFAFFVVLGFWVASYSKNKITEMSNIPFNEKQ